MLRGSSAIASAAEAGGDVSAVKSAKGSKLLSSCVTGVSKGAAEMSSSEKDQSVYERFASFDMDLRNSRR